MDGIYQSCSGVVIYLRSPTQSTVLGMDFVNEMCHLLDSHGFTYSKFVGPGNFRPEISKAVESLLTVKLTLSGKLCVHSSSPLYGNERGSF